MSDARSLSEVHRSVPIPQTGSWIRRLLAFAGPAYLVSVGYMDPGNWATDLAGGARFGYQLLWVLLLSNLMAVLLQSLAARLGVVTGKDLAQACRDYYPRALTIPLWLLAEIAIIACDLAEVLGAAVGLKLLFGVPLLMGVSVMALDVLLLLALSRFGIRRLEAVIITLIATMGICFALEILLSKPHMAELLRGFVPRDADGRVTIFARTPDGGLSILGLHRDSLYIAIGILGATVMPHNIYLHSALVQTRVVGESREAKKQAATNNLIDSVVALNAAFFVNAAILIVASAAFHSSGHQGVATLEDAHSLLAPLLGTSLASVLFAVALLASGQASTITGTLAGQVVMEGFLRVRLQPWVRRLLSRSLAIIPAALVIGVRGEGAVDALLVLSQVVLSLQLSFAIIPLITFTSQRSRMGEFANRPWVLILACVVAILILSLNGRLVAEVVGAWFVVSPSAWWLWAGVMPGIGLVALLLAVIVLMPLLQTMRLVPVPAPVSMVPAEVAGAARASVSMRPSRIIVASGPKRVALALELGPADLPVLDQVCAMPLPADAEIYLLHVAESAASRFLGVEAADQESRDDRAALEAMAADLRSTGLTTHVLLGNGDVKSEVVRMVREVGADLLITGSHGHRFLGDLFLGATASGVRHRVSCPVLTIRGAR